MDSQLSNAVSHVFFRVLDAKIHHTEWKSFLLIFGSTSWEQVGVVFTLYSFLKWYFLLPKVVCSLKLFFKKLIMGFCRYDHSEQLFPLELLLKMRSYSSGNRRIFGKMSGIFAPFSKDFLRFSKIGLYLTPKNAISCHIRQKIEKMAR